MSRRKCEEIGRTDRETDKREISTAVGSKRNAEDCTDGE
jgi:hypothetical protein